MNKHSNRKVFISYAISDKPKINLIRKGLLDQGFTIASDSSLLEPGDKWSDVISYHLNASDFLVVCLTKKLFKDGVFTFEFEKSFFEQAKQRNITMIPILLEDLDVPDDFKAFQIFDFRTDPVNAFNDMVKKMLALDTISFEHLSPKKFEEMTFDILQNLDFKNIKRESEGPGRGIDFIAEFYEIDPFNRIKKDIWLIETKFYKESRFDLSTVKSIIERYKYIGRQDAKLLLITNTQLTSVVTSYLNEIRDTNFIDISVIDGFELKKIIANQDIIANKYFSNAERGQ